MKKTVLLNPEVFREAAIRLIRRENDFCCPAIEHVCWLGETENASKYLEFFGSLFCPESRSKGEGWWDSIGTIRKNKEARILALLLAAEILRDIQARQSHETAEI